MPQRDTIRIPVQMSDEFEELITVMQDMIRGMEKAITLMAKIKETALTLDE